MPVKASCVPSGDAATLRLAVLNGGANENRIAAASGTRRVKWPAANAAAIRLAMAARVNGSLQRPAFFPEASGVAAPSGGMSSSHNQASPMSRSRFLGSFSRQRRSRRRACVGIRPKSGSLVATSMSVSETVSPANGRSPVSISYRMTPKAQMSARLSTSFPRACSGGM